MDKELYLKPGRDKSVRQRHPWIFSGAIDRVIGAPQTGETVAILSNAGEFLGRASYSPLSQIRARLWSWEEPIHIGPDFFSDKLARAIALRLAVIPTNETNAYRLVHGESDGLPGFIVDRYADTLVVQILSAGAEFWREIFVESLVNLTGIQKIYERSDVDVRRLEGLTERVGSLVGVVSEWVTITENGLNFRINIHHGQKTGFYLDQRINRQNVRQHVSGRKVLNCFCYTGAFTIYSLAGGASYVLSIDSSSSAMVQGTEQIDLNGFDQGAAAWIEGDVFQELRRLRDSRQSFDAIILDPPKFAQTSAQVEKASRAYKDINLLAFKLLRPGGYLFTFSCSGGVSAELFQKIVAGAALDAKVDARILHNFSQGADHPVALNFPEGAYLKGLVCVI